MLKRLNNFIKLDNLYASLKVICVDSREAESHKANARKTGK